MSMPGPTIRTKIIGLLVVLVVSRQYSLAYTTQGDSPSGKAGSHAIVLASTEAASRLVQQVRPVYPFAAKQQHVEGPVTVHILVGRDGKVLKLTPTAGNPLLLLAAMDAIAKWRYRPYVSEGEPAEFESDVTFRFSL